MRIVIVQRLTLHLATLREIVRAAFPAAHIAEFQSWSGAWKAFREDPADVAILRVEMEDLDGLDFIPEVSEAGLANRLVIECARRDPRTLAELREIPFAAFLDARTTSWEEYRRAFDEVAREQRYVSAEMLDRFAKATQERRMSPLSPREELILSVLGMGLDNETASSWLAISPNTVRTHRANIMRKLGFRRGSELTSFAVAWSYVRYTPGWVLHPGFEKDLAALRSFDEPLLPPPACLFYDR